MWNFFKECFSWLWKSVAVIAVIAGLVGFYYQFLTEPNVSSQIVNEINVLDVHRPLANLQVLFQGNNIQENNLNLKAYRVKFQNTGNADIKQNDFDTNNNWGIRVEGGTIIEVRLVESDSDYIKTELDPRTEDSQSIKFNKVLFDKKRFFTIELLVLHSKNVSPTLYRTGKISGIQEGVYEISRLDNSESFLQALLYGAFYGSWFIILLRILIMSILSIAIFVAGILVWIKIDESRRAAKLAPQPPQQPRG